MSGDSNPSEIASTVTSSSDGLAKVITGASEAAGVAFSLASVEKFKHGKDSPDHVPDDTPLVLEARAAELEFLPSIEASGVTSADVEDAASKVTAADVTAAKAEVDKLAG